MDLDEICRFCLSPSKDKTNINSYVDINNSEEVIHTVLTWCFNIEIFPEDKLPQNICSECLKAIRIAYRFKKTAENSRSILIKNLESKEKGVLEFSDDEPLAKVCRNSEESIINSDDFIDETSITENSLSVFENNASCDIKEKKCPPNNVKTLKYYYCTVCSAKFSNPTVMYRHYLKLHECDEFGRPCDFCNQRFQDFKTLIEHRKKHFHPYVCSLCWEGFYEEMFFNIHKANCKPTVQDPSLNYNVRKMIICHICGKSYPSTYITLHMKIHNEGSLPCSYCGKKFKQPASLGSHIIWNHKKEKKHKCKFCDRLFMTSSARGTHIRETHMKEKNIACETCGKLFFCKSRLRKHNLTHTGEKNFTCNICSKSYQRRHGLNVHMKSHTVVESWKT